MDWDSDEPWEHIYDNNGEEKASSDGVSKFGRLTYARVAGTGCQWVFSPGEENFWLEKRFEMNFCKTTWIFMLLAHRRSRPSSQPSLLLLFLLPSYMPIIISFWLVDNPLYHVNVGHTAFHSLPHSILLIVVAQTWTFVFFFFALVLIVLFYFRSRRGSMGLVDL